MRCSCSSASARPCSCRWSRSPDCECCACSRPGGLAAALLLAAARGSPDRVALGLTSGSAVSGLPAGWGGALGLAAAHGLDSAIGLVRNPPIAGPARLAALLLFALAGLGVGYVALGLTDDERGWLAGLFRRQPRERRAAPRATEIARRARHRRCAAEVAPDRRGRRTGQGPVGRAGASKAAGRRAAEPRARRQLPAADGRAARAAAEGGHDSRSTAPGSSATPACSNRCSRISTSAARSSRCARGRWSPCTSSSRRAASRRAGSSSSPTISPATCRRCRRGSRPFPAAA